MWFEEEFKDKYFTRILDEKNLHITGKYNYLNSIYDLIDYDKSYDIHYFVDTNNEYHLNYIDTKYSEIINIIIRHTFERYLLKFEVNIDGDFDFDIYMRKIIMSAINYFKKKSFISYVTYFTVSSLESNPKHYIYIKDCKADINCFEYVNKLNHHINDNFDLFMDCCYPDYVKKLKKLKIKNKIKKEIKKNI